MSNQIQINIPSNMTPEEQNAIRNIGEAAVGYAVTSLMNGTQTPESIVSQANEIKVNIKQQGNTAKKVNNQNAGAKKPKRKSPAKKPKSKKSPAKKPKRKSSAKK